MKRSPLSNVHSLYYNSKQLIQWKHNNKGTEFTAALSKLSVNTDLSSIASSDIQRWQIRNLKRKTKSLILNAVFCHAITIISNQYENAKILKGLTGSLLIQTFSQTLSATSFSCLASHLGHTALLWTMHKTPPFFTSVIQLSNADGSKRI